VTEAPPRGERILLSGYYGHANLGDEALLQVISATLRAGGSTDVVEALSADVAGTRAAYGIEAVPRGDLRAVRAAIRRADVVLSGGGGLLQNATSLRSLLYYAGILRTAIRAGKTTMIFAQSIGPLDGIGRRIVRECCRGLGAATVRDARSRDVLAPLVPDIEVAVTADPVFLYEPSPVPPDLRPFGIETDGAPLVVACVRRTARFADGVPALAAAVDRLIERHGARVAFLPFAGRADTEAAEAVVRACRTRPTLAPVDRLDVAAAAIARADAVIGVRLHALILAARFGVPFLAVPYDPKVRGLCEDLAYPLPALWDPSEISARAAADVAIERVDALLHDRLVVARHLADRLPEMQARARANFRVLTALRG